MKQKTNPTDYAIVFFAFLAMLYALFMLSGCEGMVIRPNDGSGRIERDVR